MESKSVVELLLNAKNPILFIHQKPDGDCIGSFVALATFFQARGEQVSLISSDPVPKRLSFLLEGIHLAPISKMDPPRTKISVDVASPAQLGPLYESYASQLDLMIDHHAVGTYPAPSYVEPYRSSCGEVLFYLFKELEKKTHEVVITPQLAKPLYAAIASDTNRFLYSNTQKETLLAAAELVELLYPEHAEINRLLFENKSKKQLQAEGLAMNAVQLTHNDEIAYVAFSQEDMKDIGPEFFSTAIDIIRTIEGVQIAMVLKEQEQGGFRVSLRALTQDVSSVAKQFEGGGHRLAAGCTLSCTTKKEALQLLLPKLESLL